MKILIFATDLTPLPGVPTSGTALRTWGIAQGLKARGHEVHISVPRSALRGFKKRNDSAGFEQQLTEIEKLAFDTDRAHHVLAELQPDVVICGHWPAMALRMKPSQALIVDLAGPHLLERHYQGSGQHLQATLGKLAVVATADYFLVSGPSQELYFKSFMVRAGKEDISARTATVVMPMDPKLPKRAKRTSSYPKFIFGGVFLPWQDPAWALKKLVESLERRKAGKLRLIGGKHPNYDVKEGDYKTLFDELSRSERVQLSPMMPIEEFGKELATSDVALDLMAWNIERELAVTIRTTSYLWSGVPVIYNDFADLSHLIKAYDAGWALTPGDDAALETVIEDICSNKGIVTKKSQNAQKLAKEVFAWDKAVIPIERLFESSELRSASKLDIVLDGPESADFPLKKRLSQRFQSRIDNLASVDCRMATHGKRPRGNLTLRLLSLGSPSTDYRPSLRDSPRELVIEKSVSASMVRNNDWLSLDFPPIARSTGQTFLLEMESDNEFLSPWVYKSSPYPLLDLEYGGEPVPDACICIRTSSK